MSGNKPFRRPPEGVISGASIPRENEVAEIEDGRIEEVENALRARGEPFLSMGDDELRERALEFLQRAGDL